MEGFFVLGGSKIIPSIVEEIAFVGIFLKDLEEVSNFKNSRMTGSESPRDIGPPRPKIFNNFSKKKGDMNEKEKEKRGEILYLCVDRLSKLL